MEGFWDTDERVILRKDMVGIYSWFGYDLPLVKRLKLIKEAGFDATMVWWGDEMAFSEVKKSDIPKMVRDAGLYFENIHIPYINCNNLWSSNEQVRNEFLESCLSWLEDCAAYSIPVMVMHVQDGTVFEGELAKGLDSIKIITDTAEDIGVNVAVENTRLADIVEYVLTKNTSESLGLCYDSSHDWVCSHDKTALLEKYGKRLMAVHLSDNDGMDDRHWLPGEGIVDWEKVAGAISKSGYLGSISLEAFPGEPEAEKPIDFLKRAYERALQIKHACTMKGV